MISYRTLPSIPRYHDNSYTFIRDFSQNLTNAIAYIIGFMVLYRKSISLS